MKEKYNLIIEKFVNMKSLEVGYEYKRDVF